MDIIEDENDEDDSQISPVAATASDAPPPPSQARSADCTNRWRKAPSLPPCTRTPAPTMLYGPFTVWGRNGKRQVQRLPRHYGTYVEVYKVPEAIQLWWQPNSMF